LAQVESQASALGTNYQQMTAYSAQATATTAALTAQLSGTDSTDLAQASTDLTEANNSYQSGLWAISQIQQDSLVQYLS
jgi:flagellin-like hook-associated protein FlgL